jgi:hypothetical protein
LEFKLESECNSKLDTVQWECPDYTSIFKYISDEHGHICMQLGHMCALLGTSHAQNLQISVSSSEICAAPRSQKWLSLICGLVEWLKAMGCLPMLMGWK